MVLLTCSGESGQPEAVEVKSETEQQSLPRLSGDSSAGSVGGGFAFDGEEDGLDQGEFPYMSRGSSLSLTAHPDGASGEASGGNHAVGSQLLAAKGAVALAVQFGIGPAPSRREPADVPDLPVLAARRVAAGRLSADWAGMICRSPSTTASHFN